MKPVRLSESYSVAERIRRGLNFPVLGMIVLAAAGLTDLLRHIEAPEATRVQLERVHVATYLDQLEALVPDAGLRYLDPDTPLGPATLSAARRAAGAVPMGPNQPVPRLLASKAANASTSLPRTAT